MKRAEAEFACDMFLRNVGWLSLDYPAQIVLSIVTNVRISNPALYSFLRYKTIRKFVHDEVITLVLNSGDWKCDSNLKNFTKIACKWDRFYKTIVQSCAVQRSTGAPKSCKILLDRILTSLWCLGCQSAWELDNRALCRSCQDLSRPPITLMKCFRF
jgi:hypothetical protein